MLSFPYVLLKPLVAADCLQYIAFVLLDADDEYLQRPDRAVILNQRLRKQSNKATDHWLAVWRLLCASKHYRKPYAGRVCGPPSLLLVTWPV